MNKLMVSAAALALLGGSAVAADLPAFEPPATVAPVPEVFSWTGFYVGLQGGYAWADAEVNFGEIDDDEFDADGWLVGGFAGYNYQFANPVVVGIEADLEATGIDDDGGDDEDDEDDIDFNGEVNFQGSLRGRLGYAIDRVLPYVTGGLAFADVDSAFDDGDDDEDDGDNGGVEWGWTAGAGVDVAVTNNIFVRGEYRYTNLSDIENDDDLGEVQDLQSHAVRVGVAYKF